MKSTDVKLSTYIDSNKGSNNKDPKFKLDNIVRTSKYKNIFAKDYVPNWSEEIFVIKKVRTTAPWTYVILKVKILLKRFTKMNCRKTNQNEFRAEKVIKRKGDKIYVK